MTNSFKNKHILITGISGFVGKHLAEKLEKKGAVVYGISRTTKAKRIFTGDIQDIDLIEKINKKYKIDICFHLAAEALVESGQKDPYKTFRTNIEGTLNILESARRNNLSRVIIASTSHVYGSNPLPFKEEYPPKPSRPYETSKTCVDLIAQSYADSFNLPVLISRLSNIYGPGDVNFKRLIPKTVRTVLSNESPEMWGGGAVREFIYIDDAVNAYLKMALAPMSSIEKNRIYNFGTGKRYSVKDVIEKIIALSGKDVTITKIADERTDEIKAQYVSSAKARRVLKWAPKTPFDKGLHKTIVWYKENFFKD
jgi:CDP-glucose 4,6-dehydratase